MDHRYEPPTVPVPAQEHLGAARSAGLRRLSQLTWRVTQLSAVTAVGFATLFARNAPAQPASQAVSASGTQPSATASSIVTSAPTASHRDHKLAPTASQAQPTARPGQPATSSPGSGSPGASSPSRGSRSSSPPAGVGFA